MVIDEFLLLSLDATTGPFLLLMGHRVPDLSIPQRLRTLSVRGFQTLPCAQVVCQGHGFLRNLRAGFYDLVAPGGGSRQPLAATLVRAWNELTLVLSAA